MWADTPRAVAEAAELVFTSLPGPPEVEAVALGENGLLSGMSRGKAYFDLSTNARSLVQKIHAAFAAKGAHVLDGCGHWTQQERPKEVNALLVPWLKSLKGRVV